MFSPVGSPLIEGCPKFLLPSLFSTNGVCLSLASAGPPASNEYLHSLWDGSQISWHPRIDRNITEFFRDMMQYYFNIDPA